MTTTDAGRVGVALLPADPWRKCWRCGCEYMGLSACPDCTTENAPESAAEQGPDDAQVQEQLAPWLLIVAEWARR